MALQLTFYLYRNINSNDDTKVSFVTHYVSNNKMEPVLPPVSNYNWSNGKKVFKEWNTKSDGTGITYQVGDYLPYPGEYDENFGIYAIWESVVPYDKINWQTGDIITAEKLNHMESGIAAANEGEILHITATEDESYNVSFSIPAAGAWAAIQAGKIPVVEFVPYMGVAITLFGRTWMTDGVSPSIAFYNKNNINNYVMVLIVLHEDGWNFNRKYFPDLEWLTQFEYSPSYSVLGFNHTDQYPDWETVEYVVTIGTLVSPLILAACNAAASGKTTLAANFSGDMAHQLHSILDRIAGYVRHGRGAGFLYDLDTSTGQRFYARVDSVYSDEPEGKDIESASIKAKILPTATGYYEISSFAYAENDYSQSGDPGDGVYSGYYSVTAEKVEPTFVPMS